MEHLQLHGLHHILTVPEPQDQFVTFLHTAGCKPHPVIEVSQFIGPLLPVIPFFKFFQNPNTFFQVHVLRLIELILQNVAPGVLGGCFYKLIIIVHCLHKFFRLNAQLAERIADGSASRFSLIGQLQHILCIFIAPVHLIQITDHAKHHDAFYPPPVDHIRDIRSLAVLSFCYQRFYFIRPYFIFIFIQRNPLPLLVKTTGNPSRIQRPVLLASVT